jgi:hypothetical protein
MDSHFLTYVIDHEDRLVSIDEGFREFAAENGWDGTGEALGRSLWEFVAGEEMQKLQRMLIRRIRDGIEPVELPFRCDSPEATRTMSMRIASRSAGRFVAFTSRLIAEQQRDRRQPQLSAPARRDEETLTMCGWCDRFLVAGDWVPVEVAAAALDLFLSARLPAISHGACPDCTEMLLAA